MEKQDKEQLIQDLMEFINKNSAEQVKAYKDSENNEIILFFNYCGEIEQDLKSSLPLEDKIKYLCARVVDNENSFHKENSEDQEVFLKRLINNITAFINEFMDVVIKSFVPKNGIGEELLVIFSKELDKLTFEDLLDNAVDDKEKVKNLCSIIEFR